MGKFASNTTVSVRDSKAEIERTVDRYGATGFMSAWHEDQAVIAFTMAERQVRFRLTMPRRDDPEFNLYTRGRSTYQRAEDEVEKRWGQACRQRWRALALVIKAKLEAIDCGISEFDDEFLSNIVLPDKRTVGEAIKPDIRQMYLTGNMQNLLPDYSK